jgi:perosamine synthetase
MIPFIKPYFDIDDFRAVKEVMQSGWVAQGPKVEEFEEAVAEYLGCRYVISVTNCTTALTLSLMALGIGKGDEVIVPDFTFPATALAVTNVGATPVLVDVSMVDYNIQTDSIGAALTKRTKAIIPVHLFGLACDMKEINRLALTCGLFVIEDAACSLGAEKIIYGYVRESEYFSKQRIGTFGDIGCFSLHASKGITTGEGGLVCTNSELLADKIRQLSSFGDERAFRRSKTGADFNFDPQGGNHKMSDITAAIGLSQLKKIDKLIDWRIKIAEEWDQVIANDPFLSSHIMSRPQIVTDRSHIYQSYVAVCNPGARPAVMNYMKEKGFQCGIGTHACHVYDGIGSHLNRWINLPNSRYLYDNAISFPRYYGLNVKEEWDAASNDQR